jgi:hypothetical protein
MSNEVRDAVTPRAKAALARNLNDPNNHSPAVEAAREKLTANLAKLSADEFTAYMVANQTEPKPLPPSPGRVTQDDISAALGSELLKTAPVNLTTGERGAI